MPSVPQAFDGDSQFSRGMNSQIDPTSLVLGFYRASMNTTNRGGMVQCRPGYDWMFNMPDGRIQGAYLFHPTQALEILVFAVEGNVFASEYPYREYYQLTALQFRAEVDIVYFCQAEVAAQYNEDGSIKLVTPFKILIMQDGDTPAGAWDGNTAVHVTDPLGTPTGGPMAWSGDRLWVARRNEIFAGDINNPLGNREGTYLGQSRSFLVNGIVTALAEVTANPGAPSQLLAFTNTTTTLFQSSIRTRSEWATTQNFQQMLFPALGCVSPRSVVTQYGLLWWYSNYGLTNFDSARATYLSSEYKYQDSEMAASRAYLHPDGAKIAAGVHENYLMVSVPHADVWNSHTWVLDKNPIEGLDVDSPNAWNSYWTGTRPVEWACGVVDGKHRSFHFSRDYDGTNRCWEAFSSARTDNGCAITWTLETRAYTGGDLKQKDFRFADVLLAELGGDVDVAVFWAGTSKGAFKRCASGRIRANRGVITDGREYPADSPYYSLKKQSRTLRTTDTLQSPVQTTSCQVESNEKEVLDRGFQLLFVCSGPGAVKGIRMFTSAVPENTAGLCFPDESDEENFVRFDGLASDELSDLDVPPEEYTSSSTGDFSYLGIDYTGEGNATSIISQKDADKVANCHRDNQLFIWQALVLPQLVGVPE